MKNYTITVNGVAYDVTVEENMQQTLRNRNSIIQESTMTEKPRMESPIIPIEKTTGDIKIEAGAAGKILKIIKKVGDVVKVADQIAILEVMKMETPVVASENGTIVQIHVNEGEGIEAGQLLFSLQS